MLWLLPISGPSGDGLQWGIAEQKNADARAASSSTPVEEWLSKDQRSRVTRAVSNLRRSLVTRNFELRKNVTCGPTPRS